MRRIAILGGSTPFSATFFDELDRAQPAVDPARITLFGRDADALDILARYGSARLGPAGWSLRWTTNIDAALDSADLVLHQIRYGGLEGRAEDERYAASFGVPADETLGPAGLRAAIRMAPGLFATAEALRRCCPAATVVNLTNPLSCSTTLLARWAPGPAVGLCELPGVTLQALSDALGIGAERCEWDYHGLNHRGFLHNLRDEDGGDLLEPLLARMRAAQTTIEGVSADTIEALGAVPLKYFRLFAEPGLPAASRATYLSGVRRSALEELRARPHESPPSLARRPQPWYRLALVPFISGLGGAAVGNLTLTLPDGEGDRLAREYRAGVVDGNLVVNTPRSVLPDAAQRWLDHFVEHERRVLDAALDPSETNVRAALDADPLLTGGVQDSAAGTTRSR